MIVGARGLLAPSAAKSHREQLTLVQIFKELLARGYGGNYDALRRYPRGRNTERAQSTAAANVPLIFAPNQACSSTGAMSRAAERH